MRSRLSYDGVNGVITRVVVGLNSIGTDLLKGYCSVYVCIYMYIHRGGIHEIKCRKFKFRMVLVV